MDNIVNKHTIGADQKESEREAFDDLSVARALEEDIIFGRLAPGARLVEDVLLERFHVTRHFVRQALLHLEQLGMVVRERNKGAHVRSLTPDEVRQIYVARELVQRHAALLIPLPASDALIEKLMNIHNEHGQSIEAGYLRGIHESNDQFHMTLFGACGNQYLVDTIERYMGFCLLIRGKSIGDQALLKTSHEHHRLMIEMLKGQDNWVLAQLCVDHLQPSKLLYLDIIED
jgi:DNA-binding GntR family transcriptional regulator